MGHGVNMAIAWGFKTLRLAVDLLTVVSWMTSVIDKRNRVRTKGITAMLVKCHLGVMSDIITEYCLDVTVGFVPFISFHFFSFHFTYLRRVARQ